ncbi:ClpA/ClpB-like protein [Stackebrandtia albiflava]|uniref:ClpA/ClpB-like protein n=1 Tax=Stackebrandtia albiflava TaxID=406432 RepID=A0A562UPZ8_9ACTN|nr:Clp protease N-terminal domain-containing protein [Stackebrandtia albiflava]TWJ07677.1 ClpA/ClpB-like protein [Stackebrandtia albiflava]
MSEPLPVKLDDLIHHVTGGQPDGDALQHLSDAVLLADRLGEQADHLIGHFVDRARRSGASWTQIGQHMGVSKQAVQKRFVANRPETLDPAMFTRFTDRTRTALETAQRSAANAGHTAVEPSHLLLGVLADADALATRVVTAGDVTLEQAVRAVRETLPPDGEPTSEVLPLSPEALDIVSTRTLREALGMGHNYVGTEHLLLATLSAPDNPGARALVDLGIDHTTAKAEVTRLLASWLAARRNAE